MSANIIHATVIIAAALGGLQVRGVECSGGDDAVVWLWGNT